MKHKQKFIVINYLCVFALLITMSACTSAKTQNSGTTQAYSHYVNERFGLSDFYILKFNENANGKVGLYKENIRRTTASGEVYNPNTFTAAHKSLPFNTIVRVSNLSNGRTSSVRINDRIPPTDDNVLFVSKASADELKLGENTHIELKIIAYALCSADTLTPLSKECKIVSMANETPIDNTQATQMNMQNVSFVDKSPSTPNPKATIKSKATTSSELKGEILVQIGAYRIKNNAIQMEELYKNFRKYTSFMKIAPNGLHEVFLQNFDSIEEARYFIQTSPVWDNFIVVDGKVFEYSKRKKPKPYNRHY